MRKILGNIPYDGPHQGFAGIDVIPRILFEQTTDRPVDMIVDQDNRPAKRGVAGDDKGNAPAASVGGDGGWNIFRGTTPFLVHDGTKVTPSRYNLHLHYEDSPTGASTILDTILRECDPTHPGATEEPEGDNAPRKKQRESNSPPVITNAANAASAQGDLVIVEASSEINVRGI